jgi:hypothetical protein
MLPSDILPEDIDAQGFRIVRSTGSAPSPHMHFGMISACLLGDYRDGDEMRRRVRCCTMLRDFPGMRRDWMIEELEREIANCDAGHGLMTWPKYLKTVLDF